MAFKPANCPNCGGQLQIPDDKETVNCMYCGSPIVVKEVIKVQTVGNIENLLQLADSALESANSEEAINYYNQVLEYEGKNSTAWIGKGIAVGWSSTLANFRINEMINCVFKGIEYSNDPEAEKIEASEKINMVSIALFDSAVNHIHEFASVEGTWDEFIFQCEEILFALERAYNLNPESELVVRNILTVCNNNLKGISYFETETTLVPSIKNLNSFQEAKIKDIKNKYEPILKEMDPTYEPQIIKKEGSCFVVTATMGDENHETVKLLRDFRDHILINKKIGQHFIKSYYSVGPSIARLIDKSKFLKRFSYVFIVVPAKYIVVSLFGYPNDKN